MSERGTEVLKRGVRIQAHTFVVTAFYADDEIVFHAYDSRSCETLRCSITTKFTKDWFRKDLEEKQLEALVLERSRIAAAKSLIRLSQEGLAVDQGALMDAEALISQLDDPNAGEDVEADVEADVSASGDASGDGASAGDLSTRGSETGAAKSRDTLSNMFDRDALPAVLHWLMKRLHVIESNRVKGRVRLILAYELDEVLLEKAACRIQGMWKIKFARRRMRKMAAFRWEKRFDFGSQAFFYVDLKNGDMAWVQPYILGSEDLPDPPDKWRAVLDDWGGTYYMNPFTGQTAWISELDAAKVLQRFYRARQGQDYGKPTIQTMVRALRMHLDVERKFAAAPERLSSIVNYALLLHTQSFDMTGARKLYKKAMAASPENPVLLRAYAVFLLAVLEPPRNAVLKKVLDMCRNAELRDSGRERFLLAEEAMFHWAVTSQRDHPLALLNFALVQQLLVKDFEKAERFYRRALSALNTFSGDVKSMRPCVVQNFQLFEFESVPGGAFATLAPTPTAQRNSISAEDREEWGEWASRSLVSRQGSSSKTVYYWWNSLTQLACWAEPDWKACWEKRISRSEFVKDHLGWKEYKDIALGGKTFYYHHLQARLSATDPHAEPLQRPRGATHEFGNQFPDDGALVAYGS